MPRRMLLFILFVACLMSGPARPGENAEPWRQAFPEEGAGVAADKISFPAGEYEPMPALDPAQVRFLRERAEEGDAAMQCLYGLALFNGSAGRIDTRAGREWLRKSAEAGDGRGGFEYGKMLYLGTDGPADPAAALAWLIPAAEKGNNEAAYYVGATLLVGEGVEHDPDAGERFLRQAARSGLVDAQADLGLAFYSGIAGIRQDYGEALRWFTLAAKRGHGDSCNKLGVMHQQGHGVRPDMELAILWFNLGASLGDPYAQYNLANCYMNGDWVARDYGRSAYWHHLSARGGNVESQYCLGCFYAEGIGVKKDAGRAREWLALSEQGGHERAGALLERLWELDDDAHPGGTPPPIRMRAAPLLRKFAREPLEAMEKGRVVLLELDGEVNTSPAGDGCWYLTVPGSPGVIYCEGDSFAVGETTRPEMILRGIGGGYTGLPGFLRLEGVRKATVEEIAASDAVGAAPKAVAAGAGKAATDEE